MKPEITVKHLQVIAEEVANATWIQESIVGVCQFIGKSHVLRVVWPDLETPRLRERVGLLRWRDITLPAHQINIYRSALARARRSNP